MKSKENKRTIKILCINSSQRKDGSSYQLVKVAFEGVKSLRFEVGKVKIWGIIFY
ncbi:MAG: hypothetical protein KJ666_02725 [Bacteroidetes bacterium]|nr:hypothetical protein [Bacteroidota bacterium]